MEQQAKKDFLINLLFILTVAGIIYVVYRFLLGYLMPFVVAAIIAWLVQKPSAYFSAKTGIEQKKLAPILAGVLFLAVFAVAVLVIYRIILFAGGLLDELPQYMSVLSDILDRLKKSIDGFLSDMPEGFADTVNLLYDNALGSVLTWLTSALSGFAAALARKALPFSVSAVVAAVAGCYIAKDYCSLRRFLREMCGKRIYKNIIKIKIIITESVLKILKSYLLLMLITYVELCVGLLLLGVKYAPLAALGIAIIDILPVLGTGTVLLPWAAVEIAVNNNRLGIGIIIMYILIIIIRNFAEPKIIGKQTGISPLLTLLSMFIGIRLFGVAGLVILPVTLIVVVKYYKNEIEQENGSGL